MATTFFAAATPTANSAAQIGDGFCAIGEFCTGKNDSGAPWADWNGDTTYWVFNDWRYAADLGDSPNDDGEYAINGDEQAQLLFEDPNLDTPFSCFPQMYASSDMKGRENNDSSLTPQIIGTC